jgi:membrane associated rhomboid family serine protease
VSTGAVSLTKVRDALVVMVGLLVLLWVIQVANWADGYRLDAILGIQPHSLSHLGGIVTAPFLHVSWQHIESNSAPLFVLGFLAAYRGVTRFLVVTGIAIVTSGLTVWLFQGTGSVTVGASGLVFGYFGYVLARGLVDRNWVDIAVGVVAGGMYYYILSVAVPGTPGISWLDHSGGLAGGVLAAWLLRARRPVRSSHDQTYGGVPVDRAGYSGAEGTGPR